MHSRRSRPTRTPSPPIARREEIDFTIIGPELPLSRGVADVFAAEGDLLFGPTQRAARLESSKVFAKEFMQRCNVPTARYKSCETAAQAVAVLRSGEFGFPVVLKADGLAAGKGVVIARRSSRMRNRRSRR